MMISEQTHSLSHVLDKLEQAAHGEQIAVREIIEQLGQKSFASLMLVFSLVSASPASSIPGVTALVAVIIFILIVQLILGRESIWLPGFIMRRQLATATLCKGINWLRKPVRFVEKLLRARLSFIFHRPLIYLPFLLILGLTLFMPFMEVVPTSGSLASAVIAIFAAGLLTRDGAVVIASLVLLAGIPLALWQLGFGF